jgi:hypothetical protein
VGGHPLSIAPCLAEFTEAELVRAFGLGSEVEHVYSIGPVHPASSGFRAVWNLLRIVLERINFDVAHPFTK